MTNKWLFRNSRGLGGFFRQWLARLRLAALYLPAKITETPEIPEEPNKYYHLYWFLPLLFFIVLFPLANSLIQHYPDERHYIDAALLMLRNHDFITPHKYLKFNDFSESLRFNKPIITYWVVLGSFKLFGIHIWSLRIFFLLAGTITLILTALTTQIIYQNHMRTGLAMVILMAQIQFVYASVRAIPDILLVLFFSISVFGVLLFLANSFYRKIGLWLFYLGAALAIETKGLLAVVFVVYTWIFSLYLSSAILARESMATFMGYYYFFGDQWQLVSF